MIMVKNKQLLLTFFLTIALISPVYAYSVSVTGAPSQALAQADSSTWIEPGSTFPITFSAGGIDGNYYPPPLAVQFNDTSTNSPTSWNWSFGDGNTPIDRPLSLR